MSYGIKKLVTIMTVLLLITNLLAVNTQARKSPVIPNSKKGIPDKGLYLAILKGLGKKSGTFTKAEAAKLTGLDALNFKKERVDIKNLKGIGYLSGLTWLELSYNNLTNLKGIGRLTKLESLSVGYNKLVSLRGIEKLSKLKDLSVDYNNLTNLKGIEALTALSYLEIQGNKLVSIKEVENLTNLTFIHAYENKITDLSSIKNCTKLEGIIMDRNRLKNLSGVEGLTNLSSISAGENRLVSIKGVENLTNLSSLEVNDNKLHSINGVENLTNLYSLNVLANKLEKLPDLKKLENLIYEKTSFLANHLSANEIAKNVPEKFRTYPSWLNKQIKFQNVKMMLKLIKPKTPKKITSKTRRITGKTDKRVTIVMKSGREEIRRKKANKKGIFTFKKLDFKKWRDKKVTIQAYFWVTYEYKYIIKTMAFRV